MAEKKRYIKVKKTGAWVRGLEFGGSALDNDPASHRADIAAALGMKASELEAVDRTSDPRKGKFINMPPKAAREPTPREVVKDALERAGTVAEIKGALADYFDGPG